MRQPSVIRPSGPAASPAVEAAVRPDRQVDVEGGEPRPDRVRIGVLGREGVQGERRQSAVVGWAVRHQSIRNGTKPAAGSGGNYVSRQVSRAPWGADLDITRAGPGS